MTAQMTAQVPLQMTAEVPAQTIEGFRPSTQQKRLWSLRQSGAARPAQAALQLSGPLDVRRLEQAFDRLVERHEILRTRFHCEPGMKFPVQVVDPQRRVQVRSGEGADAFRRAVEARPQVEELEVVVVHLGPDEHGLLVRLPALHADARTLELLLQLVAVEYAAIATGTAVDHADEPLQYIDFTEWQAGLLEEPGADQGTELWRDAGRAAAPPVVLPFAARTRAGFRPERHTLQLAASTRDALADYAARVSASPSEVLHACWVGLVMRLSGAQGLVTGLCTSGRTLAPMHAALGPFAQTLPVRVAGSAASSFEALLASLRAATVPALKWQHHLRGDELSPRDGEEVGYVATAFEYVERPRSWTFAPGLSARWLAAEVCSDRFELKLMCVDDGAQLALELHHDSGRYGGAAAVQLAEQLGELVRGVLREPRGAVARVPLVTQDERARVLAAGRGPEARYRTSGLVHELFEAQARERPDALALVDERERLTYGAADRLAERLGEHLQTLGVGPEQRVVVLLPRDVRLVVALLAVSKAGGAYVALDGRQPVKRLQAMLEEASPAVVLTHSGHLPEGLSMAAGCAVVELDRVWDGLRTQRGARRARRAVAGNGVYVIFTSGSTGRPKAVVVEHRQLSNYVQAVSERCGFGAGQSHAWVSTVAADLGHTALYGALCSGGVLHVISEERAREPAQLAAYMRRDGIDCLKIVPSHLHALSQQEDPAAVLPRERLVLGGETARPEWLKAWQKAGCTVYNHYGPTEATVGALTHRIEAADDAPLGRPLANVEALVLDGEGELVSRGEVGEIQLGGHGVARGYLGRPDATAERFVPDPYARHPGERLYRTGDLGRQRLDGAIDFLGRRDHQVKIRGFRVELGEIEAILREYPGIEHSAVVLREGPFDRAQLTAYIVPVRRAEIAEDGLRAFLRDRLPEPMQPAGIFVLDAFPRMGNGKIDRAALPAPEAATALTRSQPFVAPRNEVEQQLAQIWADVLRLERVGVHENFFRLGGDSILSIQIVARATQAGLRMETRQLFRFQTIAELGAVVRPSARPAYDADLVSGEVPLTPIQRWFFEHTREAPAHRSHWNQSVMLEVSPSLDPDVLENALQALSAHHDMLRARFVPDAGGFRQDIPAELPSLPLVRADLSSVPDAERPAVLAKAVAAAQAGLDLGAGRLLRGHYFSFGSFGAQRPARLLIVLHHLVVDGVSWRILLEDLQSACEQLSAGAAVRLPSKTTSFQRWSERLSAFARSEQLRDEAPFWLASASSELAPLPRDHQTGVAVEASMRTIATALDRAQTAALLRDVPQAYHTQIEEVLLTALAQVHGAWTGRTHLHVELEGHGREDIGEGSIDVSRTVGWFTTHAPIVIALDRGAAPGRALLAVKEQLRAIPRRGIGYGLLRYLGDPSIAARLAKRPDPEINFNYLGQFSGTPGASGYFGFAEEGAGPQRAAQARRHCLLYVNGSIVDGVLRVDWTYSEHVHDRTTVERLSQHYIAALTALIQHCLSGGAGGHSPADFPDADLSQAELDSLLTGIAQPAGEGTP